MGPFGDGFTETLATLDFTGFAGGFWDSENNGDHFGAREYQKTHGSWLSPDPAGMAAVNPWNPQTWNRYAYVGNNPTTYNDSLTLYLYSGSAQAFTRAVENGMISPTAVDAIQQIVFLSPGTGDVAPTTMGLPDSAVQTFWGNQGIQDNLVWMLNGSGMSAPSTLLPCGHSFACEFNSPQVPKPRGRCAGH
jgi:RHS repeat-associated protein